MLGQVYQWVDENGNIAFGDNPPEGVEAKPDTIRKGPTEAEVLDRRSGPGGLGAMAVSASPPAALASRGIANAIDGAGHGDSRESTFRSNDCPVKLVPA